MNIHEREVMQRALEALERWRDWDDCNNTAAFGLDDEEAITALREALKPNREGKYYYKDNACTASSADSPDCICWHDEALAGDNMTPAGQAELNLNCKSIQARLATSRWYVKSEQAVEQEQKPVGMVIGGVFDPWNDDILSGAHELYAAPVRTKDLTDEEIEQLVEEKLDTWSSKNMMTDFARAVIAADREKNLIK